MRVRIDDRFVRTVPTNEAVNDPKQLSNRDLVARAFSNEIATRAITLLPGFAAPYGEGATGRAGASVLRVSAAATRQSHSGSIHGVGGQFYLGKRQSSNTLIGLVGDGSRIKVVRKPSRSTI